MKKLALASVLLLLLAVVSIAEGANYQIYSENRGFMGLSGRKVIMLDKATGDSWIYVDDKWKPIVKEATTEAVSSADVVNAKLEAEITSLKEKHLAEIKALTDKQEQELASLNAKLEASKPAAKTVEQPVRKVQPAQAKKKAAVAKSKAEDDSDNNGANEAPPAWLTE